MNNISYLPLILAGVFLNALAQLSLKQGAVSIASLKLSVSNAFAIFFELILNPWIFAGLVLYAVSVIIWILALSKVDVSFAYPMLSIGYVLVAIFGVVLFGESLSLIRIAGIVIIIIGVILISKS